MKRGIALPGSSGSMFIHPRGEHCPSGFSGRTAIMTGRHFDQHMGKYLMFCTLLALTFCFILDTEHAGAYPCWILLFIGWFCAMCAHVLTSASAIWVFQNPSSCIEETANNCFKKLLSWPSGHEGFQHEPIMVHSLAFGGRGMYTTAGVSTCAVSSCHCKPHPHPAFEFDRGTKCHLLLTLL